MNNMLNSMKEYGKKLKKESAVYLAIENAQLEERIEKAIEYIEYCLEETCEDSCDYLDNHWIGEKLLEILRGDSNE